MRSQLAGIHHVTAIAGDPQRNIDFYTQVLGLRLVKLTVNYDDPSVYHLYYGNDRGQPGAIITFFAWPGAERGRKGTGQATLLSFLVPLESLPYWGERLEDFNIPYEGPIPRFDDRVLTFFDPDHLHIELVGRRATQYNMAAVSGPVPAKHAIRRLCGITCAVESLEPTASFLTGVLGFRQGEENGNRYRYITGDADDGDYVDVLMMPGLFRGRIAVGDIHHVAWRAPDYAAQEAWQTSIAGQGIRLTALIDRTYFRSFYFREPGGLLMEIATDEPGFTIDEAPEALGTGLMLPSWLEERRAELEKGLPPLQLPAPA